MAKTNLKSWPLRPGMKHVETVRRVLGHVLEFKKFEDASEALSTLNFQALVDEELDALIELCIHGSDLSKEQIEEMSLAAFLELTLEVIAHNTRPLMGLSAKLQSLKSPSSTPQ